MWRNARKVRRNVGTTGSRCIFIPDGADAADESGYVGSLLPSFVSLPSYPRRSLTAAATPSSDRLPRPPPARARTIQHSPLRNPAPLAPVIFSASSSFATSKPVLFWTIRGIFRHTGVRPNAVIHHPRCNTPYNVVLCRMADPSLALMLLPNQPSPSFSSRHAALCGALSSRRAFHQERIPPGRPEHILSPGGTRSRFKRDYYDRRVTILISTSPLEVHTIGEKLIIRDISQFIEGLRDICRET